MLEAPRLLQKGGASRSEGLCEERDVRAWGELRARKGGLGIDRKLVGDKEDASDGGAR